jgi:acyl carrier protein
MALEEKLSNIFFNIFGLEKEKFSLALAPEDVANWDSIGHMNMVMDLEKEFDLQFEVDEIMEMSSPQKILDILRTKGAGD